MTRKEIEKQKQKILDVRIYPWDQQFGEPDKDFALFLRFLSIGRTRNYAKVAKTCEISYSFINKSAEKYQWRDRANKHDLAKDEELKIKLDEEIMISRIRQAAIGSEMQDLAQKGLKALNSCAEELSPMDVAKLADIGVKIQRLALNNPTEITESKIDAKVEMAVENVPPELAARIGKELAIESSEKMSVDKE